MSQNSCEKKAEASVSRPGPVGDSRVHYRNSRAGLTGTPQEVGPEFGFRKYHQLRFERPQVLIDGKTEIQREIEDILLAKSFARQLLPGNSGGRDYHAMAGKTPHKPLDQSADGKNLSYGNRMDPDDWPGILTGQSRWHPAEPFTQSGAVFAVTHHLDQPVRKCEQQPCCQKRAVEPVHEGRDILNGRARQNEKATNSDWSSIL